MKVQALAVFIFGVCCIRPFSAATGPCLTPQCFDCTQCEVDCNTVAQVCDSDCLAEARKFLCNLENRNCKTVHGCNVPSVDITFWPAVNHDTSNPAWAPLTKPTRPNCCYELEGLWDNTTSGITINGQCVILYDGHGCTGESRVVDATWTQTCLDDFTCPSTGGFNDKPSSYKLC